MTETNAGNVTTIAVSNLRNGALDSILPAIARGTIPAEYTWRPITSLPPAVSMEFVAAYIRTYFAMVGAGLTRVQAIALGAVRAAMSAYYRLTVADFELDEVGLAVYAVVRTGADGDMTVVSAAPAHPRFGEAQGEDDLTDAERALIPMYVAFGISALPLNGAVLEEAGHHYIPSHFAYFVAVERQVLNSSVVAVREFWNANSENLRDVVWHKAGHPVSMALKRSFALSHAMKERLVAAKLGSAAVRLPVVPSVVHNLRSALAVLGQVVSLVVSNGGALNYRLLQVAEDAYNQFAAAAARGIAYVPDADMGFTTLPELMVHIHQVLDRNADHIAFCVGIFQVMVERSGAQANSLSRSYTLRKIREAHLGAVDAGMTWARAANSRIISAAARGEVAVQTLELL